MKIGIDARMYGQGNGIARYIEELIAGLEIADPVNQYVIFLRKHNFDQYIPRSKNFTKRLADVPWYSFSEQIVFPLILYREQLDLVHFPHFSLPIFYIKVFVVTIHDLIMLNMPRSSRLAATSRNPLWYEIKYAAYSFLLSFIVRKARCVITVSNTSKHVLASTLKIHPDHIRVIYNGISQSVHVSRPAKLQEPFFLCVGNMYPHKNYDRLLEAWKLLKQKSFPYHLHICGQEDYFASAFIKKVLQHDLADSVSHIGRVSEQELAWLYQHAVALLYPSLQEGFGLPAIEALSYSLPVLASDIPVFHEILGDRILYFNPHDARAIANAIDTYIKDRTLWIQVAATAPHELMQRFNWKQTSLDTLAVYNTCIHTGFKTCSQY